MAERSEANVAQSFRNTNRTRPGGKQEAVSIQADICTKTNRTPTSQKMKRDRTKRPVWQTQFNKLPGDKLEMKPISIL